MKQITKKFLFTLLGLSLLSFCQLRSQEITRGYLVSGSDSLYYQAAGSGNTIVFIHDGMLPHMVYDSAFREFMKDHYVVAYDRRGYGKSSPATGNYTHLGDLEALFGHLDIRKAILVAASSGGALAIDFTLENPDKVEGLVLIGAVVGGFTYTNHMRTRGGHLPAGLDSDLETSLYYATKDPYEIADINPGARRIAEEIVTMYPHRIEVRPRFTRPEIPAYKRLGEIRVPALILTGEYDIPDVHAHSGVLEAGIEQSRRIIVSGSGHLIPLERPEALNEYIAEFLQTLE
jgi:3-oxoadipate enol-lactonase